MKKTTTAGCDQTTARQRLDEILQDTPNHPTKTSATMIRRALKAPRGQTAAQRD